MVTTTLNFCRNRNWLPRGLLLNVLFLTLVRIENVLEKGIYTDLMRKFRDEGHSVYIVTPRERKYGKKTKLVERDGVKILGVKTLNIQKTNIVEKGIGTLLIELQYKSAIKKYLKEVKFDLGLYSTPPITFTKVVKFLKKENPNIISYLLLKDIFLQNAVDIGMFSKKSLFYKFFRKKEIELYKNSDYIGCMSPANVKPAFDEVLGNKQSLKKECLALYRNQAPNIHFYDGAETQIKMLREKKIKIGVITDGRPEGQRAKIVALGLEKLVDEIIVTDELGGAQFRKPCDIAFRIMQKKLNVPFDQIVYVGDNPKKDFIAPYALEMRTIWFKNVDGLYSK